MSSEDYATKFSSMIMRIPKIMFVFEVTKACGYSEFVLVYKDSTISDLVKAVSMQFEIPHLEFLFFKTFDPLGILETRRISIVDTHTTIREMITDFQNDESMDFKPIYTNTDFFVVYRIFYNENATTVSNVSNDTIITNDTIIPININDCINVIENSTENPDK